MGLGVPGEVVEVTGQDPLLRKARVRFGAVVKEVSVARVPEVQVGEWVLVHVGLALARLDEARAQEQLRTLARLSTPPE